MADSFSIFKSSKYTFDGKKPYENVIHLLYRHWFVLFGKILALAILLVMPVALYLNLGSYVYGLTNIFWFLYSIYLLIWWHSLFYILTMYLLDTWIVTDHRIIDSEQHGFFHRMVAELNISRIQDISVIVSSPIATFLDYGNLEIQTAGTEPKFVFKQIPHPNKVKDEIMRAHNEYMSQHRDNIEIHEKQFAGI
ncbi:MAG: hypothetical protein A3G02_02840 [Candidatus Yanofskybacteria bacterium RIFCSPLOWO2_12_FULL_44_13b]|uniref:YdbS-like PH domain-containing protein n=2 Tax=Patescibacteria group TaxID=1783273 RepID=A0A0G1GLE5_9BACT|nr:MAG: hypothetical protein UV63_C0037G0003 [Microgenomates group bacterium GW2011_GWC1_43_11]KKT35786.1 MAG: hypothetical protein UW22_C0048G0003 [Candidatus Gottesmanbacteria bacterium GW2011_GWB1_44_11c]OGN03624.1 MAG: hypothetical protein A2657_00245 [Candidatus Yanofskybacteria bacterium RIFCSPHIGHO2_01_FULL_44_110b]OGN18829.1 MAG: hypothetical protein A3F50_00170 [Candidatus Yanofskybacteria bacterium RIFCSPHIGHO2_12_FULL_44_29b]OGN25665.1 MAG: hypothetical protein A3B12_00675 [Candidatu